MSDVGAGEEAGSGKWTVGIEPEGAAASARVGGALADVVGFVGLGGDGRRCVGRGLVGAEPDLWRRSWPRALGLWEPLRWVSMGGRYGL